jgi:hypothetical protein
MQETCTNVEVKIQVFTSMALHGVHMGSRFTLQPLYLKTKAISVNTSMVGGQVNFKARLEMAG